MMMPVRWFLWVPAVVNALLALAFASFAGTALSDAFSIGLDLSRLASTFGVTALFLVNAVVCGVAAQGDDE